MYSWPFLSRLPASFRRRPLVLHEAVTTLRTSHHSVPSPVLWAQRDGKRCETPLRRIPVTKGASEQSVSRVAVAPMAARQSKPCSNPRIRFVNTFRESL